MLGTVDEVALRAIFDRCWSQEPVMDNDSHQEIKLNIILAVEPGNPNLDPELAGSMMYPRKWVFIP